MDLLRHIKIMFRTGLYMEQLKEEMRPHLLDYSTDYILQYGISSNHDT